jgi:hypothetical protein
MRSNGEGKPVVAVDIDGTMADYHGHFLRFAEQYLGSPMPSPTDINPGMPLNRFMTISKPLYREVKLAYRQGGLKRSMPVLAGSQELIRAIRAPRSRRVCIGSEHVEVPGGSYIEDITVPGLGAEVWVCTTRPYLRLDNIDPDTREWLRRNDINYDALLFDSVGGDNKYRELIRQAGDRVACALEDLPEQAVRANRAGVPYVFLRDQPYNQHFQVCNPGMESSGRFRNGMEAYLLVSGAVESWRQRHSLQGK